MGKERIFTMFQNKIGKKLALSLLLALAAPSALPQMTPAAVTVAEAHMMSCKQERGIGDKVLKKSIKGHNVQEAVGGVANIQNRLVTCNSDRLNMQDGKHKRYLSRTLVDSSVNWPNAFMAPGGKSVIYAKQIEIDRKDDRTASSQTDPERPLNLVNYSAESNLASTLAHEYGHYANEDFLNAVDRHMALAIALSCIPTPATIAANAGIAAGNVMVVRQETFNMEKGADATGVEFLANVPEYSMGSMITSFQNYQKYLRSTNQKDGGGWRNFVTAHSHTDLRIDRVRDRIAEVSQSRVMLSKDGVLTVDGERVNGTGRLMDMQLANGRERTNYLAGQIASTMKRHYWKPQYLRPMKESEFTGSGSEDRTVFVVCEKTDGKEGYGPIVKVLGTFDYPLGVSDCQLTALQKKAKAELQSIWNLTRTLRARMKA